MAGENLKTMVDMGNIITQALPMLFGTGNKTQTTKQSLGSALSPDLVAALQSGISSGKYSSGQAVTDTNMAVTNALQQAFRQFMPRIATAQVGQGMYNSAATDKAVAAATGEASVAAGKLQADQIAQYQQNEINLANVLSGANKTATTTETTKQQGLIDPMMAAAGLGGLMLLDKAGGFSGIGKMMGMGGGNKSGGAVTEGVRKSTTKAFDESLGLSNILDNISLSPDLSSGSIGKMSMPSWATMGGLNIESPNVGASSFLESPSSTGNVQSGDFSSFMNSFGMSSIMSFFENLFK